MEICATSLYRFGESDGAAVSAGSTPAPESGAAEEGAELWTGVVDRDAAGAGEEVDEL